MKKKLVKPKKIESLDFKATFANDCVSIRQAEDDWILLGQTDIINLSKWLTKVSEYLKEKYD